LGEPVNDNPAYDARSVANGLLDVADGYGLPVTNIGLQKLLYFTHGAYLTSAGQPLVGGYFEAWKYGPVHPQVYSCFKVCGAEPIRHRAMRRDFAAGAAVALPFVADPRVSDLLSRVVGTLGRLPAARLVALSHAPGGPWYAVANEARTRGCGVRIHDTVIVERFFRHKLDLNARSDGVSPVEEALLTA
jgi:uncharacterized phage-associated protein